MSYAISDIIQWAKASQPLAFIEEAKKIQQGGTGDLNLHTKIYLERKTLEYAYADDPTADYLFEIGNYVLSLIGIYLFEAQQATGGGSGSSVTPPTSIGFPIYITQADFSTATLYERTGLENMNLAIYLNQINRYLESTEYTVDSTGITITLPGFDATANSYTLIIERVTLG